MDRSNFSRYRVLVMGAKTHTMGVLRSILANAGITQIIHVEEADRALELLATEHFTAVFCDAQRPESSRMNFPVAARRRAGMLNPMIPIFAIQERTCRSHVEQARDIGITDMITMPVSPKTILTKLKAAELAPRAFIVSPEFFGPDRRAKNRAVWEGAERRKRAGRKTKVDFNSL